jgi:uncharacterized protein (DUF2384 family)
MQLIQIEKTPPPSTAQAHAITAPEAEAMARAVINLFQRWGLTDAEACTLLGGISPATYGRWKQGQMARIGVDLQTRLSLLIGIHKALRLLFTDSQRSYAWVKKPNAALHGKSALQVMLAGQITDLLRVRYYLDSVRG